MLAIKAAIRGGEAIMEIYEKDFSVDFKKDNSPLTEADRSADKVIHAILSDTYPIISEESKTLPYDIRKDWNQCWLVDPLDGTKEFIKRNGEFTVNIAFIEDGIPKLGVVYLPVTKVIYFGSEESGSFISTVLSPNEKDISDLIESSISLKDVTLPKVYTIVASRSHMSPETELFISESREKYGEINLISKGSSIKLCLVAEGKANVYPRIAPTMEWDTAAAHAVAKYAGCKVLNYTTGKELVYNKENLLNPYFIVTR